MWKLRDIIHVLSESASSISFDIHPNNTDKSGDPITIAKIEVEYVDRFGTVSTGYIQTDVRGIVDALIKQMTDHESGQWEINDFHTMTMQDAINGKEVESSRMGALWKRRRKPLVERRTQTKLL